MIDEEVRSIISDQYAKAMEILQENKQALKEGAGLLIEKEKIDGETLKAVMDRSGSAGQ